jgi:hypothetical protein
VEETRRAAHATRAALSLRGLAGGDATGYCSRIILPVSAVPSATSL